MATADMTFGPSVVAPRLSRDFVRAALAAWKADDLNAVAALLTSELVTNVVCHAVTDVHLSLEWHEPTLRVEVADGSSIEPAVREFAGANGGWGLRFVEVLAESWGVTRSDAGKAVWFEITTPSTVHAFGS